MKLIPILLGAAALVAAASLEAGAEDDGALRIGGSTTLLPVIAESAKAFAEAYPTWDQADPALPRRETRIFVGGGGSGFGVRAVVDGTVAIGMISRELKPEEKDRLGPHRAVLIGRDAVVIAARLDNPLAGARSGFTSSEIAAIFAGEAKTYQAIDRSLPASPVVVYVRDSGAGSAEMFQELILKHRRPAPDALQVHSQGTLLNRLESNPRSMGYLSSGLAWASVKLKVFALDGVAPTHANVIAGRYSFTRPLLLLVRGEGSATARRFIDYVLSAEGQGQVARHDYVPANAVN